MKHPRGEGILRSAQNDKTPQDPKDPLFSNRVGLVLWLVAAGLLAACQKVDHAITTAAFEVAVSSPTPIVQVAVTQPPLLPTNTPPNPATATSTLLNAGVPESTESKIDLLALKATHTPSPTATPTPGPDVVLITDEPIFVGGDVRLQGWSPNGRYLAYFEYTEEQLAASPVDIPGTAQGTFTFYDAVTEQKCQRYALDGRFPYEGPEYGFRFTWLANGDLLIFTEDGQAIQTNDPCGQEENLTAFFPEPIRSVGFYLNDQLLLLTGTSAYWLYNVENHNIYPIAEITPDLFNNLVPSPGGTYIGVTLAGNYAGNRSPIGGTRVVDVVTGQIVARYDWEPANALDGTFGGPVWLNENEMIITFSLDKGPFFMTVDGEVRPLLPFFGLEFTGEPFLPYADVYVEPDSGHYHILLTDWGWSEEKMPPQVYHSDTDLVETLENLEGDVFLMPGGIMENPREDSTYLIRSITDVGAAWERPLPCAPPWQIPDSTYFTRTPGSNCIDIFAWPDCERMAAFQLDWAAEDGSYLNAGLSPDNHWLVIVPVNKHGRGQALFVIPLPEMEEGSSS
ncbi:MAG: hypothetical protein H6667_04085 [Ardenticatenaceae bacterium]|nr:hypothetical protein [Ardenticatenaceae bacterium]MCB9446092.1 hypothetical protein [Ardenticatenaceae bacterium]